MRKIMFACAFAALGTVGFAASEASAKGFGGGHWGGGHGHWGGGHGHWGGGGHYWGGPRFVGRPVVYFAPRCRWVPGYAGWVRVCR